MLTTSAALHDRACLHVAGQYGGSVCCLVRQQGLQVSLGIFLRKLRRVGLRKRPCERPSAFSRCQTRPAAVYCGDQGCRSAGSYCGVDDCQPLVGHGGSACTGAATRKAGAEYANIRLRGAWVRALPKCGVDAIRSSPNVLCELH